MDGKRLPKIYGFLCLSYLASLKPGSIDSKFQRLIFEKKQILDLGSIDLKLKKFRFFEYFFFTISRYI